MKVLIIAAGIPMKGTPLAGIFAFDQAKALKSRGVDVMFFAIDMRSMRTNREIGISYFVYDGIRCGQISFPVGRIPAMMETYIGSKLVLSLYSKADFEPDIIHAHFSEIGHMALKLSRKERIPLVVTEHSSKVNKDDIGKRDLIHIREVAYGADCLISVSGALAEKIYRHTQMRPRVIPNIVDVSLFDVNKKKHDGFNIVNVGNLIPIKGQGMLIDAFELFHRKYPHSHLYIIGEGSLRTVLLRKINRKGLENSIELLGKLDRREIGHVFQECDVFAFSSMSETFGVSCIEALASGLPVVSTNCGGPSDFIDESNGIIIKENSEQEFCLALEYIYNFQEKYDSKKISDIAKVKFSPTNISDELMDVYAEYV